MKEDALPTFVVFSTVSIPARHIKRFRLGGIWQLLLTCERAGGIASTFRVIEENPGYGLLRIRGLADVPVTDGANRSAGEVDTFGWNGPDEWIRLSMAPGI
jgi:hypothetical protein